MVVAGKRAATLPMGLLLAAFAIVPPAGAAPASADRSPAKVADAGETHPVAATETEEDPVNCNRSRKRLWVEGEGWIVRKVTICR